MLTPQAIDVIEAALNWNKDGLEGIDELGDTIGRIDTALAELAALRTERQGQHVIHMGEKYPSAYEQGYAHGKQDASTERQGQPMDFPDGPGWWAFEGIFAQHNSEVLRTVLEVVEENGKLFPSIGWDIETFDQFEGAWTKVRLPWDTSAPPANPVGAQWVRVPDTIGEINDDDLPLHYLHTNEGDLVYLDGEWRHLPIGYAICRLTQQKGNSNE